MTAHDRVVLVTGAASGLGRSHALRLPGAGMVVAVNEAGAGLDGRGVTTEAVDMVVEESRVAGDRAVAGRHGLSDPGWAEAAVRTALDANGRLGRESPPEALARNMDRAKQAAAGGR